MGPTHAPSFDATDQPMTSRPAPRELALSTLVAPADVPAAAAPCRDASGGMAAARTAAGAAASDLADLFFRADEIAQQRANRLRKRYRLWRVGDEATAPHADVLALKHASSAEEGRTVSTMRRARTIGSALNNAPHWSAADGADLDQTHDGGFANGCDMGRAEGEEAEGVARCSDGVRVGEAYSQLGSSAPPMTLGGCPFRQGEHPSAVVTTPVAVMPVSTLDCGVLPSGGCPFLQEPDVQPPRLAEAADKLGYMPPRIPPSNGAPSTSSTAVPAVVSSGVAAAAANSLSAEQLAAFQAAYVKALAEQKEALMQGQGNRIEAAARLAKPQQGAMQQPRPYGVMMQQQGEAAAASSSAASAGAGSSAGVAHASSAGALAVTRAPAAPLPAATADEDHVEGTVLSTSCAHGPLVTHPDKSIRSGMLASVFPSSKESWLYVVMAGEFGAPWPLGINAAGTVYGRLQFKSKMQQWALLKVEQPEWQQVSLDKVLSLMHHAWGEHLCPPKGDERWICFPYLYAQPSSVLDLPTELSTGKYTLDASAHAPQPSAAIHIPEATVQRDVKAIGARPAQVKAQVRAPRKRSAKGHPAGATPTGMPVGAFAQHLKRQRNGPPGPMCAAAGALCASMGAPPSAANWGGVGATVPNGDEVAPGKARALQDLLLQSLGASRLAALSPAPSDTAAGLGLPPSQSMIQLLQYLESVGANVDRQPSGNSLSSLIGGENSPNGSSGGMLPENASVQSLLGLLRSSSLQHQLNDLAAPDAADRKAVLDLKSVDLATLARAASSTSFEDLRASVAQSGGLAGSSAAAAMVAASAAGVSPVGVSAAGAGGIVKTFGGMPPPQDQPPLQGAPLGAPTMRRVFSPGAAGGGISNGDLDSFWGGMRESPSVSSLVDLVRESSATSLIEYLQTYTANNNVAADKGEGGAPDTQ